MMAMDFLLDPRLRDAMDENEVELIRLLYTRVGMIMEDASVIALALGGPERFDDDAVEALEQASAKISSLLAAARSLVGDV